MGKWKEWVNVLEKNPNKPVRALAKEFNKTSTWVQQLKTFYNASSEEKENLKDKHAQYSYFYRIWKEETNTITEAEIVSDEKSNNSTNAKNKNNKNLPRIPYYQIEDLKKVIKRIALENKHLIEENNSFAEDNLYKAKSINQLINEKNELQEELRKTKLDLKITTYSYYLDIAISVTILIMGIIKCSG